VTRPIPAYLLPHTATLYKAIAKDVWGKETYTSGDESGVYTLKNVRFEPVDAIRYGLTADLSEIRARLFVDAAVSTTEGAVISTGDRIVFDGKEYRVVQIQDYYAEKLLHHREVYLQ
jgi:hypothetical protein